MSNMHLTLRFILLAALLLIAPPLLPAQETFIEVTAPGNRQLKLAVDTPRTLDAGHVPDIAKELGDVIAFDLTMSGVVLAESRGSSFVNPPPLPQTDFTLWKNAGYDLLVRSEYSLNGEDLTVEFRLFDLPNSTMMAARRYLGKKRDLRRFAHSFSDEVMLALTGEKGCFTTRIAFVSTRTGNKEIAVMDWDGHNAMPLTNNRSINLNPDFSPDGREILFSSYKNGNPDLYRRSLFSTTEVPVSTRKGLNITGTWAPDGKQIALTMSKDGDSEIYTISRDGSKPVRLTTNPAIDIYPTWSPDGTRIAFVSDRFGKPQIFTMNTDGTNVKRLTGTGSYNVNPRWSPQGDKIAYVRMEGGTFHIYTINTDGSNDNQLTSEGNNENPSWSPDGRFITFSSKRNGQAIYVIRADGSGQTKVSQGKGSASQPAWSPRY